VRINHSALHCETLQVMNGYHQPVLQSESVAALNLKAAGTYVDATFGGGGHSRAILGELQQGRLVAFDQDEASKQNLIEDERFMFIEQNFRFLIKMLRLNGITQVDGILADLGVSSFQIDTPDRGFSYRFNETLDMRMSRGQALTANKILMTYDAGQLQNLFSELGEVRNAKTLAHRIVEQRKAASIQNTNDFLKIISPIIRGNRYRYLSQVFQALRMEVNDEVNALKEFLQQSAEVLRTGGRLVIITYHSLEARLVKQFIRRGNFNLDDMEQSGRSALKRINKKSIEASDEEKRLNPRSRSAHLYIAEKIEDADHKQ
jgi:16S rRNA (cytosine1402-N4)-methyltransferase